MSSQRACDPASPHEKVIRIVTTEAKQYPLGIRRTAAGKGTPHSIPAKNTGGGRRNTKGIVPYGRRLPHAEIMTANSATPRLHSEEAAIREIPHRDRRAVPEKRRQKNDNGRKKSKNHDFDLRAVFRPLGGSGKLLLTEPPLF